MGRNKLYVLFVRIKRNTKVVFVFFVFSFLHHFQLTAQTKDTVIYTYKDSSQISVKKPTGIDDEMDVGDIFKPMIGKVKYYFKSRKL